MEYTFFVMNDTSKRKLVALLLEFLRLVLIGVTTGVVVGVYQLGLQGISKLSSFLYGSSSIWLVLSLICSVIALSLLNFFILKWCPSIDGSGIPVVEQAIRKEKKLTWKKDIPGMIANSFASTFVGFPLGSEGPSVVLGGKIGKAYSDLFKRGDDSEDIGIASGAGFGCAFLSPLAGLVYSFEESMHRVSWKLIIKGVIVSLSSFGVTFLINHHHLLEIETVVPTYGINNVAFIFVAVLSLVVGLCFKHFIVFLKDKFNQFDNIKAVKYRGYLLFALMFILNVFLYPYMGSGSNIISSLSEWTNIALVIGVLVFRFALTSLSGAGKVTGGLVVPIMCLGALVGRIAVLLCGSMFEFDMECSEFVMLFSMVTTFTVITKAPMTSIVLVLSALVYSSSSFDVFHTGTFIGIICIVVCHLFVQLFRQNDLYDEFIDVSKRNEERLKAANN